MELTFVNRLRLVRPSICHQVSETSPWKSLQAVSSSRRVCEMRPGLTPNLRAVALVVSLLANIFATRRL